MCKRMSLALGSFMLLGSLSAQAVEFSGNVALLTDYAFRGISQTSENPAIQGGFDAVGDSGLYVGVWASNVDFDGSIEIDLYAGYGGSLGEDGAFDLGVLRYEYPDDAQDGAADSSFNEVYASVGYKGFTLGLAYSNEFFLESGAATYLYLDYEVALPNDVTLGLHYGNQSIDDNGQFGTPDYADYSVGVSRTFGGLDVSLTLHDTDLSGEECFGGPDDICEARLVLGLSKSL